MNISISVWISRYLYACRYLCVFIDIYYIHKGQVPRCCAKVLLRESSHAFNTKHFFPYGQTTQLRFLAAVPMKHPPKDYLLCKPFAMLEWSNTVPPYSSPLTPLVPSASSASSPATHSRPPHRSPALSSRIHSVTTAATRLAAVAATKQAPSPFVASLYPVPRARANSAQRLSQPQNAHTVHMRTKPFKNSGCSPLSMLPSWHYYRCCSSECINVCTQIKVYGDVQRDRLG